MHCGPDNVSDHPDLHYARLRSAGNPKEIVSEMREPAKTRWIPIFMDVSVPTLLSKAVFRAAVRMQYKQSQWVLYYTVRSVGEWNGDVSRVYGGLI